MGYRAVWSLLQQDSYSLSGGAGGWGGVSCLREHPEGTGVPALCGTWPPSPVGGGVLKQRRPPEGRRAFRDTEALEHAKLAG